LTRVQLRQLYQVCWRTLVRSKVKLEPGFLREQVAAFFPCRQGTIPKKNSGGYLLLREDIPTANESPTEIPILLLLRKEELPI
jgi:hypothetical protein